jgi:histidine triad (HIT) family protein
VVESDDKEAPFHFLVIPKQRIVNITEVNSKTLKEMFELINDIVDKYKIKNEGFRIVINTNPLGAQTVYHLHIHILAGRQLRWPPG